METDRKFILSGRLKIEQINPATEWAVPVFINDIYSFDESMANSKCKSFYLHYLID